MTTPEHDPALVEKAAQAHYEAWSFNAANKNGWPDAQAHNLGMTRAVLDAVADDIARAERERVLAEVEALSREWFLFSARGQAGGYSWCASRLTELVARLLGGEGRG